MKTFDKLLTLFNEVGKNVPWEAPRFIIGARTIEIQMFLDQKAARVKIYGTSFVDEFMGRGFYIRFDRKTDKPVLVEQIRTSGLSNDWNFAFWKTDHQPALDHLGKIASERIDQAYAYHEKQKKKGALKPVVV